MAHFRTTELSDPEFEDSGLRFMTVRSPALGRRGDITLFVPEDARPGTRPVPLVLLLHGVYGSHWSWAYQGGAHRTARRLMQSGRVRPMVIAMPSDGLWGDGSAYLPHTDADHERWIMEDVVRAAQEAVPSLHNDSPLFLAGLSMGGYGALRLAGKHSERIAAVSAHSAITHIDQMRKFVAESLSCYGDLADESLGVAYWLKRRPAYPPAIRFDCGHDDLLIEENRALHRELQGHGVAHVYEEFSGGHSWSYWRQHLQDTLLFFERRSEDTTAEQVV